MDYTIEMQIVKEVVGLSLINIDQELPTFIERFKTSKMKGKGIVNIYLTSFNTLNSIQTMNELASKIAATEFVDIEEKLAKDYPEIVFENPRLSLSFDELNQCWHIHLLVCVELKK